jgi:hypothetical protein
VLLAQGLVFEVSVIGSRVIGTDVVKKTTKVLPWQFSNVNLCFSIFTVQYHEYNYKKQFMGEKNCKINIDF